MEGRTLPLLTNLQNTYVTYIFIWMTNQYQTLCVTQEEFSASTQVSNSLARLSPDSKQHTFLRLSAQVKRHVCVFSTVAIKISRLSMEHIFHVWMTNQYQPPFQIVWQGRVEMPNSIVFYACQIRSARTWQERNMWHFPS